MSDTYFGYYGKVKISSAWAIIGHNLEVWFELTVALDVNDEFNAALSFIAKILFSLLRSSLGSKCFLLTTKNRSRLLQTFSWLLKGRSRRGSFEERLPEHLLSYSIVIVACAANAQI